MQDLSFLTGDRIHALLQWKLGVLTTEPLGRFLVPHPFPIPSSSNRSSTLHGCTATHHIDDLGQCHLQGDIQGLVCVCHRSQGTCVVGKEVSEQLVCQPALGSQALWRTSKKWCPWRPQGRGLGSHSLLSTRLTPCQCLHCLTDAWLSRFSVSSSSLPVSGDRRSEAVVWIVTVFWSKADGFLLHLPLPKDLDSACPTTDAGGAPLDHKSPRHHITWGMLVPRPGIKPMAPALEVLS